MSEQVFNRNTTQGRVVKQLVHLGEMYAILAFAGVCFPAYLPLAIAIVISIAIGYLTRFAVAVRLVAQHDQGKGLDGLTQLWFEWVSARCQSERELKRWTRFGPWMTWISRVFMVLVVCGFLAYAVWFFTHLPA